MRHDARPQRPICGPGPAALRAARTVAAAAVLLAPAAASAQTARSHFGTARLPDPGEVWLQSTPAFESWNRQYALDSPMDSVDDGMEEPLSADVEGPVVDRLYPGAEPFLAGLRQDAGALGYDSLPSGEFSLGALEVDRLHANRRLVPITAEVGVLDRVSARITVPVIKSQTEAFFSYDSAGATFAPLSFVVSEPGAFTSGWSAARDSLRARLDSGELSEEQRAAAESLLEASGAFLDAFSRRADADLLVPVSETRAGQDLLARVDSLSTGFSQFGIGAPGLELASTASTEALQGFFTGAMQADSLTGRDRGWSVEGLELGLRVGLYDSFRPPGDTVDAGLELRTTAGAEVRLPRGSPGSAPFVTPASFLDVPISDGQTDLEVALYQDVRLGAFRLHAVARYGRQFSDELELRVHPPDRPFPVPSSAVTVRRDPGGYVRLHLSPRLAMNEALSLGAEYSFWRKQADRYALTAGAGTDGPEVAPLAVESSERRHRLGVGVHYRAVGDSVRPGDRPVELSFLFQAPVAGAGGQTPVSRLTTVRVRVPVGAPW